MHFERPFTEDLRALGKIYCRLLVSARLDASAVLQLNGGKRRAFYPPDTRFFIRRGVEALALRDAIRQQATVRRMIRRLEGGKAW